jgi:NAD(P)-dependent dehydrogenase (short-subunit alcohol dehydrogenase family)
VDTLTGKAAIITGAASGIGKATAQALARRGASVLVVDRDSAAAHDVATDITKAGGCAVAQAVDVADDAAFDRIRGEALGQFGRVDIVMNNVGVLTSGLPEHIPLNEWQRIIDVNLLSVVRSNAVFVPHLLEQGSGHIVNTASFAGLFTYSYDRMPYAATKAAIVQMTEGLAIYLRPKNVGVSLLCPGPVLTNIANDVPGFGSPTHLRTPGEQFTLLDPFPVGEMVAEAIVHNRFFVPTHPGVLDVLRDRLHDWDAFIDFQISREPSKKDTP